VDTESTNYGTAPELQIKNVGAVHVHREGFMRFDLGGIPVEEIQDAALHLYFTTSDTQATGRTSVVADPANWGELTITYTNRPTVQNAVVADWAVPAQDWLVLDAGQVVPAQLAGNGTITFRHQILTQPSAPVYSMASRENPTDSLRPFLRVQTEAPTLDEWLAQNSDLDAQERGPLDDPEKDGLSNLLEAWLGTDPSNPDAGAMPRLTVEGSQIQLHMQLNAAPPVGLVYVIESSDTLAADDWELVPAVVWEAEGPEAGGRIPTVARIPGDPGATRRFYRVNVESW
jgi:hypothetical protein